MRDCDSNKFVGFFTVIFIKIFSWPLLIQFNCLKKKPRLGLDTTVDPMLALVTTGSVTDDLTAEDLEVQMWT